MAETHFTAGQSALFYQEGPNLPPVYLGCHQTDDVEETLGDVEYIYCPDETAQNKFKVVGEVVGIPEPPTTSLTYDLTDAVDLIERMQPGGTLFINKAVAGRRDTFANALRTFILYNIRATSRGLTGLAARTPDDNSRSEQTADITAMGLIRFKALTPTRQTTANTGAGMDVSFWSYDRPRTSTQTSMRAGDRGFVATATHLLSTVNGGGTWTQKAGQPFGTSGVINSVESFEIAADQVRVLLGNSFEDVATPMEIAYSDDGGTTFTVVTVGSAVSAGVSGPHALYVYDRNTCFVGSSTGHIYKSEDGGGTWVLKDNALMNPAKSVDAFSFSTSDVGYCCGEDNFVARTLDGGDSWSELSGPAAAADDFLCIACLDNNRAWVGSSVGKLYYTTDGGATWAERALGLGSSPIRDIEFMFDGQVGYLVADVSGVGRIYYTIDGGYTWTLLQGVPTNAGFNAIEFADLYSLYAVGPISGSTTVIVKLGL